MPLLFRTVLIAIVYACCVPLEPVAAQDASAPPAQTSPPAPTDAPVDFGAVQTQPPPAPPQATTQAAPASVPPPPPPPTAFSPPPAPPAPRERYNAINLSVLGFAIGRVRLNYERMLTRKHGVFVEALVSPDVIGGFDFVGYGGALGYRWHWRGLGDSGFVGAVVAIETADGTVEVRDFRDEESYRYQGRATSLTIAPHIGKRWVFRNGINLTVRVGFGYSPTLSTKPGPRAEPKAIDIIRDRKVGADGEASIGYSF